MGVGCAGWGRGFARHRFTPHYLPTKKVSGWWETWKPFSNTNSRDATRASSFILFYVLKLSIPRPHPLLVFCLEEFRRKPVHLIRPTVLEPVARRGPAGLAAEGVDGAVTTLGEQGLELRGGREEVLLETSEGKPQT